MAENEKAKGKKQVPLRLSASLFDELARWAEDDFRSLNGQIEYLLTECVKKRRKSRLEMLPPPDNKVYNSSLEINFPDGTKKYYRSLRELFDELNGEASDSGKETENKNV